MIEFEFQEQAARLKKSYGPSAANDEFIAMLWRKFRSVEAKVFAQAVDYMIEERANLKVSVISEAVNNRARRFSQPLSPTTSVEKCRTCGNDAMVFAKFKTSNAKFFVRCHCEFGRDADDRLPQWKQSLTQDFEIVRIPSMKPDMSHLRDDVKLQSLSDEEFFQHAKVRAFFQRAMNNSMDWWSEQKKIAAEFWTDYFSEGLAR